MATLLAIPFICSVGVVALSLCGVRATNAAIAMPLIVGFCWLVS